VNPEDFEAFEESCNQTLREMIRINRNHPSIMAWSMTNEAFFTYNLEQARALISELVALSRQLDLTRPAAIGGAQRGDVDRLGDLAGYNGDGARLFIDPGVPSMVSEYGAISKPHDAYEPFWHELQTEQFPWRSGQAIWCAFDYGTIAGKQGLKGIVDHFRLPKRSWYWYRNEYLKIPPPPWPEPGTPAKLRLEADKPIITGTDATDDCQIVVTVLDADGNHISNCPPVTLTIESGPGEFPIGRSITFEPDSDIRITAGRAAIAFRSYHGGQSVIRASSPGLAHAILQITTVGEPAFIAGTTPVVSDRPYAPPPLSQAALTAMKNAVNVALNRPSRASSAAERHPARLANDGNAASYWQATTRRSGEWWMVDLEGFYQISSARTVFPAEANYRFAVESSQDASAWTTVIDRTMSARTDRIRNDVFPPGTVARFVKLTLTSIPNDAPSGLCEMEVQGVLSLR
jgi:hypothetical protein